MEQTGIHQLSSGTALLLLVGFYALTFLMSLSILRKKENVDAYMVSNSAIGFGMAAASMMATWIWAASFFASATSGYRYGISGPIHYGLWGALMILFIYPFGKRFREVAPDAHTLAEILHARHGTSSQMVMAISNIVGSCISLMVNFSAAGALVAVLSPLSFIHGVLIAGAGVLAYTLWSGFRASVMTDFAQLVAMVVAAAVLIPMVYFNAGGSSLLEQGMVHLTAEQANFFSGTAFLEQGAPYLVAVLAYAIGNQTIAQRLFAVRQDLIKPTFLTATVGYGAVVIGLGMLGLLALFAGITPMDGDHNNLIPQMASAYLPPFAIGVFFILVVGSLSSTADSDLSALSALMMTDVYGKNLARKRPDPRIMLMVGRITMIVATLIGIIFASLRLDILIVLVFVGALWGAIVFPVITSFYWNRVDNRAFCWSVAVAVTLFCLTRFELIPLAGVAGYLFEAIALVGAGVVTGLMAFGFFGRRVAFVVGGATIIGLSPLVFGALRDYIPLISALVAYGASAIVCTALSLRSNERFDFALLDERVRNFQKTAFDKTEGKDSGPSTADPIPEARP